MPRTTAVSHASELGSWLIVRREPPPALRTYVAHYAGYREASRGFGRHLQAAATKVPLILNLGAPYRLDSSFAADQSRRSFVAGLHEVPTFVGSDGPQHCLQIDLTPLGARRIFGVPMDELANRTIELDDLIGSAHVTTLLDRIHEAASWEARFALVDRLLTARLGRSPEVPPGVIGAWGLLDRHGGDVRIGALAEELGWSNKHLITQFRAHIGLPPKTLARILRFERATALLHTQDSDCLASVAQATGYFDQSHLHRDFLQFAGLTPGAFLRRRVAGLEGLVGD